MKNRLPHQKSEEMLERFGSLPEMQPSDNWNEALSRRLLEATRRRSGRPALTVAIVLLALINAAFVLKELLPVNTPTARNQRSLEIIARDILINPDSANN